MPGRLTEFTRGPWVFDVVDEGPIDGEPVVLLHGFPQRAASWRAVTELLHGKGFRTIAPDQRGYSPRARPTRRRDYAIGELVGDVLALIDALDAGPVHLVGHDWGAAVAWSLAGAHADRVRTLTAVSVPHTGAFMQAMPRGQLLKSWYMGLFNLPKIPELLLAKMLRSPKALGSLGLTESRPGEIYDDIVGYGALTGALNWYRGIPFTNSADRPRPITVPTTYIWSDGDVALGRAAAQLTAQWVRAPYDFRVIRDADHWLPEKHAAEVADAIVARAG